MLAQRERAYAASPSPHAARTLEILRAKRAAR
jgi:hypothetical protein